MTRPALFFALAALALPGVARAQCMQPGGARTPTDPGCSGGMPTGLLPVFACACDTPVCVTSGCPTTRAIPACRDDHDRVVEATAREVLESSALQELDANAR